MALRSPGPPRALPGDDHAAMPAAPPQGRPAALSAAAVVAMFLAVAGGVVLLTRSGGDDYVAVTRHVGTSLQSWRRMADTAQAQEPAAAEGQLGPAAAACTPALVPQECACPPPVAQEVAAPAPRPAPEPAPAAPPPAEPVGFPACKAEAARILDAMAAGDKANGWRYSGRSAMQWGGGGGGGAGFVGGSSGGGRKGPRSLVAIPTANVWAKTELLLHSLAAASDDLEVLVVDELSDDGTPQRLRDFGVRMLQPKRRLGVTANWNWAYREWLANTSAQAFFISNNDVLLPNGVVDALAHALTPKGGDCDVVGPLSTQIGLGTWGGVEGLEVLYGLSPAARAFINNPLNYQRVQVALRAAGCGGVRGVHQVADIQKSVPGVSGFFFGMRRSIQQWAFKGDQLLFSPANRIIGQEGDLFRRTVQLPAAAGKPSARYCIHTGAFIYHYKGSTIPPEADRENWHLSPSKTAAKRKPPAASQAGQSARQDTTAAATAGEGVEAAEPAAATGATDVVATAADQQPEAVATGTANAAETAAPAAEG